MVLCLVESKAVVLDSGHLLGALVTNPREWQHAARRRASRHGAILAFEREESRDRHAAAPHGDTSAGT